MNLIWKKSLMQLKSDSFNAKAEAIDPAAGWIRLIIHGGQVNKAYTGDYLPVCRVNK